MRPSLRQLLPRAVLIAAFIATIGVYWSGLSGGFLFDDYPNIVENHGVQPKDVSVPSLVRAALSSPSSEFKRPLASLSFAANYLASGLDPYAMKLTNLVIHLLNGLLVFVLVRRLMGAVPVGAHPVRDAFGRPGQEHRAQGALLQTAPATFSGDASGESVATEVAPTKDSGDRAGVVAALVAAGWMLLPINLTAVVYVVQRMESMANLFVLLGLIGYVHGRERMLAASGSALGGLALCVASLALGTVLGLMAKETAVMLPLYALLVEAIVFRFRASTGSPRRVDRGVAALFVLLLAVPLLVGLAWLLPGLFRASRWATRDFTLVTRLLSEARIVADYIPWTIFPTPGALSFYHDDFPISTGLLSPWTTLASMALLAGLAVLAWWLRRRQPLVALGISLFLGCHLLTGTVLPLELIYEHRNYFASLGLMLAVIPYLAAPAQAHPLALPRYTLLGGLLLSWAALTALTAHAWGNPLRLAEDLASRAPQSPRAQYELGRTYIIYSHYKPDSPFTRLAYAPLERAAALPKSSILPEQALIFMNARMHLPLKDAWWDSMIAKLKAHPPGVQDESSLGALTQCVRSGRCDLPTDRMMSAFMAALDHPNPRPRLLATYGDYAWNVLDDHALGERVTRDAVAAAPGEPAYRITLIRMLAAQGRKADAEQALQQLQTLNIGGRLNSSLDELRAMLGRL